MRGAGLDDAIAVAAPIVADVRDRGDVALLEWTERFDGPRPDGFRVRRARIAAASRRGDVLEALRSMIGAVRTFNEAQRPADTAVEAAPGSSRSGAGCRSTRSGSACPAALPAAFVARDGSRSGARRGRQADRGRDAAPGRRHLVVARELGLDEVYAVGGAQAVAALAYGTATIPSVDRIVGPGNAFVTAAKLLVSSRVGIDLPAGPSEVVVIADETADAAACAADLLAQAEHGADSEALLLSTDPALSAAVATLVARYDNITVETVASLAEALSRSEAFAPEHLELHVADPERSCAASATPARCSSAARPSSATTQPGPRTSCRPGGLARSSGGLGLEMFMKPLQVVRATPRGRCRGGRVIGPIARAEGLPLHAAAAERAGAIVSTARPSVSAAGRGDDAGLRGAPSRCRRLRALRLGGDRRGGRRAPRPRAGAGAQVRSEHAAASGRGADSARGELRDA